MPDYFDEVADSMYASDVGKFCTREVIIAALRAMAKTDEELRTLIRAAWNEMRQAQAAATADDKALGLYVPPAPGEDLGTLYVPDEKENHGPQ